MRVPVPHAAARKIQGMILSGELKSGEKMPSQREFAQALKVSRASLREALLTLETLGLLKTEPGRGTFVSQEPPSTSRHMARWRYGDSYPVSDVFETRIMLEGRIVGTVGPCADRRRISTASSARPTTWSVTGRWATSCPTLRPTSNSTAIIASACPNRMLVDLYQSVRELLTETQMPADPDHRTGAHARLDRRAPAHHRGAAPARRGSGDV